VTAVAQPRIHFGKLLFDLREEELVGIVEVGSKALFSNITRSGQKAEQV